MNSLYILSGASGCGKTTLLNQLCPPPELRDPTLRTIRAPKYSEREPRVNLEFPDDVSHVARVTLGEFDIAYVINNTRYGIRLREIDDLLRAGHNAVIILSDFRVIRRLKREFQGRARALYVSSAIDAARLRRIQQERLGFSPDAEQKSILSYHFDRVAAAARLGWWDRVSECVTALETDWRAYATDALSTDIRAQRIRAFHIRYIEFLHLFDHVILNYTEERPEEMAEQARNIIGQASVYSRYRGKKFPPIFIVAAASGTGKGTLMEMLNLIGRDRVRVTSKVAKRARKEGDRRDGMIPILGLDGDTELPEWPDWWSEDMIATARKGEFPPQYDITWEFHAVPYGVSTIEIERNVRSGHPQIFVSNMQQFGRFRERWPEHCVMLYLHRLVSAQDHREFVLRKWGDDRQVAEIRIGEKELVHQDYIKNIAAFDHVLLNTLFEEDLFDQLFTLLEYYHQRPR